MKLIYCLDEPTKEKLLLKGYQLIKHQPMQNQTAWVFVYKPEVQFDITDSTKFFISDKLMF